MTQTVRTLLIIGLVLILVWILAQVIGALIKLTLIAGLILLLAGAILHLLRRR